jgi:4-amino-4-deoxy-L-arabinose transferase-like glycosyltransferase
VAIVAVVLVALVAMRPLLPIDETRYLDVAWEMRLSGDIFHLSRNFELYTHKPPLLFWLINLVWLGTGVAEFPARLVAPGFAVASALALARLARRLWPDDAETPAVAVLALAGFTVFLLYASATMFDTMLLFATILGYGFLWRIGSGEDHAALWAGLGLVFGFGVLAKGPVILVHLLPVLLAMAVWAPQRPVTGRLVKGFGLSLAIGVAVVALWLIPALAAGDAAYREELLWTQSAARVAGGLAHDRPVWFLLAALPLILYPWGWSIALWPRVTALIRGDGGARMLAIAAVSGLVLFSLISGKQVHYLLPEYAAVALLVARGASSLGQDTRWRSLAPIAPAVAGLAAMGLGAGLIPAKGDLAALAPGWSVVVFGLICLLVAVSGWRLGRVRGQFLLGAGSAIALHVLIATSGLYTTYDAGKIADRLAAAEANGIAVAGIPYNAEFNFRARLTTPVAAPADAAGLRSWAEAHPDGLLFGPVKRVPVSAPPMEEIRYNGADYGFWTGRDVAVSVQE